MTRYRVAVVGLGIGAMHLKGWREVADRFEVVAIVDQDAARLTAVGTEYGVADRYQSLDPVLARADIDIIDIATPPALHQPMIEAALKAGKHAICEKPLLPSLKAFDQVEALLASTGRQLMPVFQYRFGNGFKRLHALMAAGLAGKPYLASIETAWTRGADYYAVPWRGKKATEWGGALITHAIHAHDALEWLMGPIASVRAATTTRVNPIETEDCAGVVVELESGAIATLTVTLGAAEEVSRLKFHFSGLTVESNLQPYKFGFDPWRFIARTAEAQAAVDQVVQAVEPGLEGYPGQFLAFADALDHGQPPPVTVADARRSIALLTAIYRSARTGETVRLPIPAGAPDYGGWL